MASDPLYETSLAFVQRTQRGYAERGGFWAGIWRAGTLVGAIGLTNFDAENGSTELGYWLSREATGKGVATKACGAMLDYVFRQRKLNRAAIRCAIPSNALAHRLGFAQEGLLRQAERSHDGRFRDMVLYGLLAQDWCSRSESE